MDADYEKLLRMMQNLRTKLIAALAERDELVFWTATDMEADYMQKVGILEYKVVEFRYLAARMKLKVQLMQKAAQEQVPLLLPQVEKQLDEHMKASIQDVTKRRRHLNRVMAREPQKPIPVAAQVQMRQLYRTMIDRYHPLLHGHQSREDAAFFGNCALAFRMRDLVRMQQLEWMMMPIAEWAEGEIGLETMKKELPRLRELWTKTTEEIRKLRSVFPLNQAGLLMDDLRVHERQQLLQEEIEHQRAIYRAEDAKLTELLGE